MDIDPLTDLTIHLSKPDLDQSGRLEKVCRAVANVLPKSDRVSLWRFNDDFEEMRCVFLLVDQQVCDPTGMVLTHRHFPEYFDAVLRHDTVIASDARKHPDTMCFNEDYFEPNAIYSMLDYIFHRDFTPFGVICCEATGAPVEWQDRDVALLKRVAGIISMFY